MQAKVLPRNFEDENFVGSHLTMKTSKTTSLKNLYVYGTLPIIIRYAGTMLDTFSTYYAHNCAGIIGTGLATYIMMTYIH